MKSFFRRLAILLICMAALPALAAADAQVEQKVLGNHPLTLQWLSFENAPTGTARIYREGEDILVDGEQRYSGREGSGPRGPKRSRSTALKITWMRCAGI